MEDCLQLLPYGYSILDYARAYDPEWIQHLEILRQLLSPFQASQSQSPSQGKSMRKRGVSRSSPSLPPHLPLELVFEVMVFLDCLSLLRISRACRDWQALASRPCLWQRLLCRQFALSEESFRLPAPPKRAKGKRGGGGEDKEEAAVSPRLMYRRMHEAYRRVAQQELHGLPFQKKSVVPLELLHGSLFSR